MVSCMLASDLMVTVVPGSLVYLCCRRMELWGFRVQGFVLFNLQNENELLLVMLTSVSIL